MQIFTSVKAAVTIEAAFLVPVIILMSLYMTDMACYCYDRCVLEQSAYEAAWRGSSCIYESNESAYTETLDSVSRLIEGRLIGTRNIKSDIKVTANKITVSLAGDWSTPFVSMNKEVKVTKSIGRYEPTKHVRIWNKLQQGQ